MRLIMVARNAGVSGEGGGKTGTAETTAGFE